MCVLWHDASLLSVSVNLNTHFKLTYHYNIIWTMLSRACHLTPCANRWPIKTKPHAHIYISFSKTDSWPEHRNKHPNIWMDSFQTPTNNIVVECYTFTVVMLSHYNKDACILCTIINIIHIHYYTNINM